ncbi:MAG TPA: hypothetical protein VLA34_10790, partial [Candidatus Krumholzibacterium sp.]|nr:hypothetical protein [Candidatus Krumholzibacterium sp.]
EALRLVKDAGMIVESSLILGTPNETPESIHETFKLALEYDSDFMHFLFLAPWPYANLYESVKDYIEVYDYSKYNLVEPIIRPTALSLDEIRSAILDCYRGYYMRKAPEYYTEPDAFKREYLKRSMHLIMRNSFLTKLMKGAGAFHPMPARSTARNQSVESPAASPAVPAAR